MFFPEASSRDSGDGCAGVRRGGAVGVERAGDGEGGGGAGEGREGAAVQGEAAGAAILQADPLRGSPDQCRPAAALQGPFHQGDGIRHGRNGGC